MARKLLILFLSGTLIVEAIYIMLFGESSVGWALALAATQLACGILLLGRTHGSWSLPSVCNPACVMLGTWFLLFCARPLALLSEEGEQRFKFSGVISEEPARLVLTAMSLAACAIAPVVMSEALRRHPRTGDDGLWHGFNPAVKRPAQQMLRLLSILLLVASLLGACALFYLSPSAWSELADRNWYMESSMGRIGYLMLLCAAGAPTLWVLSIEGRWTGRGAAVVALIGAMSLALLSLTQGRGIVLAAALAATVAAALGSRRRERLATVMLVGLGATVVWSHLVLGGPESGNGTPAPWIGATAAQQLGSATENVAESWHRAGSEIPHDYGWHFLGLLFEGMPPEHRPIAGSEEFTRTFFPDSQSGRAGPLLSELIWSFGALGIPLMSLSAIACVRILQRWRHRALTLPPTKARLRCALLASLMFPLLTQAPLAAATQVIPYLLLILVLAYAVTHLCFAGWLASVSGATARPDPTSRRFMRPGTA